MTPCSPQPVPERRKALAPTEVQLRRALADPERFRLQELIDVPAGPTGEGDPRATEVGVVVDVETTGLDTTDTVIEFALRRFRFDAAGVVTEIDCPFSWLQDPGRPLSEEVAALTGLTDDTLAGRMIDVGVATRVLGAVSVVIAHNAAFDRPHLEKLLPEVRGKPWACTLREVDWTARGFEALKLGPLLSAVGLWHRGHRAADDVDAVIALLRQCFDDGETVLAALLRRARQPGRIIRAVGAHYDSKDGLKARGYRWDADRRVWWIEVYGAGGRESEEWWLAANVYGGGRASALGPEIIERDWTVRHGG